MTTTALKSRKIVAMILDQRDAGLSVADAIEHVARETHNQVDDIMRAAFYAMQCGE